MGKKYTFEIVIREGNDEFWEELAGKSGCDEVMGQLKSILDEYGFMEPDCTVRLVKFDNSETD